MNLEDSIDYFGLEYHDLLEIARDFSYNILRCNMTFEGKTAKCSQKINKINQDLLTRTE